MRSKRFVVSVNTDREWKLIILLCYCFRYQKCLYFHSNIHDSNAPHLFCIYVHVIELMFTYGQVGRTHRVLSTTFYGWISNNVEHCDAQTTHFPRNSHSQSYYKENSSKNVLLNKFKSTKWSKCHAQFFEFWVVIERKKTLWNKT